MKGALEATRIRMGFELISRSYKYVKIWMIGSPTHPKEEQEIHKEVRLRSIHWRGNKRDFKNLLEEVCIVESLCFRSEFGITFWRWSILVLVEIEEFCTRDERNVFLCEAFLGRRDIRCKSIERDTRLRRCVGSLANRSLSCRPRRCHKRKKEEIGLCIHGTSS